MILLALLFVCHYLADYTPLSRPCMLVAKRLGRPVMPIVLHAAVHAWLMLLVLAVFDGFGWIAIHHDTIALLFLFQLVSHSLIDLLKGRLNGWFPSLADPRSPAHWCVFGADQLAHALVILLMWYAVMHGKTI